MKTKMIVGMMLLLGLSIGASAQYTRGKDRIQKDRIEQGMRSGEITKGEAYRLSKDRRHMRREHRHFKHNDGRLSARERRHLRHDQRMASHKIYRYKHNHHHRF